jgi:hypothetical protein
MTRPTPASSTGLTEELRWPRLVPVGVIADSSTQSVLLSQPSLRPRSMPLAISSFLAAPVGTASGVRTTPYAEWGTPIVALKWLKMAGPRAFQSCGDLHDRAMVPMKPPSGGVGWLLCPQPSIDLPAPFEAIQSALTGRPSASRRKPRRHVQRRQAVK